MKVKLKTIYASSTRSGRPGQVLEFTQDEGEALVSGGYGEEVGNSTAGETDEIKKQNDPPISGVTGILDSPVNEIKELLPECSKEELQELRSAEDKAKDTRVTLIHAIDEEIKSRD